VMTRDLVRSRMRAYNNGTIIPSWSRAYEWELPILETPWPLGELPGAGAPRRNGTVQAEAGFETVYGAELKKIGFPHALDPSKVLVAISSRSGRLVHVQPETEVPVLLRLSMKPGKYGDVAASELILLILNRVSMYMGEYNRSWKGILVKLWRMNEVSIRYCLMDIGSEQGGKVRVAVVRVPKTYVPEPQVNFLSKYLKIGGAATWILTLGLAYRRLTNSRIDNLDTATGLTFHAVMMDEFTGFSHILLNLLAEELHMKGHEPFTAESEPSKSDIQIWLDRGLNNQDLNLFVKRLLKPDSDLWHNIYVEYHKSRMRIELPANGGCPKKGSTIFEILEVGPTSDLASVRKLYTAHAKRVHPDKNLEHIVESTKVFASLAHAKDVFEEHCKDGTSTKCTEYVNLIRKCLQNTELTPTPALSPSNPQLL
jgi:hypothetical protein